MTEPPVETIGFENPRQSYYQMTFFRVSGGVGTKNDFCTRVQRRGESMAELTIQRRGRDWYTGLSPDEVDRKELRPSRSLTRRTYRLMTQGGEEQ